MLDDFLLTLTYLPLRHLLLTFCWSEWVDQSVLSTQSAGFQFTGVVLLAVGVWGKVSLEAYLSLASEGGTNAPYVLIGTGAIIVIFGLFGCFATCRGSPWMLKLVRGAAESTLPQMRCFGAHVCVCAPLVRHVFDPGVPGWACGWNFRLHLQAWGETRF